MKNRREIDGLRTIAVVPVILFHAGFRVFSGGYVGVDVFFVISGFLITSNLIGNLEGNKFSILDFYERRARRILPALFLVLATSIPFALLLMPPDDLKKFFDSVVAVIFFASNILFWREENYFAPASDMRPLLHTWSLAVEEQYYLLFPVLVSFLWRFGRNKVFLTVVLLALASFAASEWGWRNKPTANFYLAPARAWELMAGSICAFLSHGKPRQSHDGLALLGLASILIPIFWYDDATPFPSFYALAPVIGSCLIIMFAATNTWTSRLLSTTPFVGIGLVSYSAYLWHQPLFAFARYASITAPPVSVMCGLVLLTFALAYLSWKFVEQPFRLKGSGALPTRAKVFVASAIGGIAFVAVGATGHFANGLPTRFDRTLAGDIGHLEFHELVDQRYLDCQNPTIAASSLKWEGFLRCKQTRPGVPDIVLLGDSHAEHLFVGLAEQKQLGNIAFYIQDASLRANEPAFKAIFSELLDNGHPQVVLIGERYAGRYADAAEIEKNLRPVISKLQNVGKTVILLGDLPRLKVSPYYCANTIGGPNGAALCSISAEEEQAQRSFYESALIKLSRETGATYLPLQSVLCRNKGCSVVRGKNILYRDDNHLNVLGSRLFGSFVATSLAVTTRSPGIASAIALKPWGLPSASGNSEPSARRPSAPSDISVDQQRSALF